MTNGLNNVREHQDEIWALFKVLKKCAAKQACLHPGWTSKDVEKQGMPIQTVYH